MANIRDVAREAGVSIATVSRIFSGDTSFRVTEQTRKNVMDAAEKLNYVLRSSPRQQKKVQLGCVLSLTPEKYADPFFDAIFSAAESVCLRQGAAITTLRYYNELLHEDVLQQLTNSGLSGLLMLEQVSREIHEQLAEKIPNIVYVDCNELEFVINDVGYDRVVANWQAMNCMLRHGYRRIAIIGGGSPNEDFLNTTRLTIYREALRRAGLPYDPRLVKDCAWDLDLCAVQVKELLSMPDPPDAIYAGSDTLASAILGTIYSMGLRCPRDIGVIGFNNLSFSGHLIPPLTTIDIPVTEIGLAAGQRLMDLVRGTGGSPRRILFPTKLIERDSLKEVVP